jgi:Histidine kinase
MVADAEHTQGRRRQTAIAAASLVAAAFEAAHGLAWEGRLNGWCVGFMAVATFIELEALTAALDFWVWRRRSSSWSFALASVFAVCAGIVEAFAGWAVQRAFDVPLLGRMHAFRPGIIAQLGAFDGLVALGLWAVAVMVPFAVRDARARTLEAEQLRTAAELARLRANLQPHFLFNTLSTIAGLVVEAPREARNLIGALGDLLRDSFEDKGEMQTLDDEVTWLKRYAEILETRHRGSITFRWEIAETTRKVRIPRLLLQPLLENAVKHGALRRREGAEVAVRATLEPGATGRLTCIVEDNGPGPGARAPRQGARGLELVRRRLALLYSGVAAFRLETLDGRTRSIVEIPAEALP